MIIYLVMYRFTIDTGPEENKTIISFQKSSFYLNCLEQSHTLEQKIDSVIKGDYPAS